MIRKFIVCIIVVTSPQFIFGQINAPGMGDAVTAGWFALGLAQKLDTLENKGWESTTYVGWGQKSNPNNYNPFYKPAIFILNQEFRNRCHRSWEYILASSYRRENKYIHSFPHDRDEPGIIQELRVYGRISYIFKTSRITLTPTFRQEFRKFYTPDFKAPSKDMEIRSRFRLQLTINLDKNKTRKLVARSEQFFAISKKTGANSWSEFNYTESRFAIYYSISPKKLPLVFDFGYMNNLLGNQSPYSVHYLAFDIIVKNPFNAKQKHI